MGSLWSLPVGSAGSFFSYEQVERRYRIEIEVASGKLPKRPAKTMDNTVLEFREDTDCRTALLIACIITVLILLGTLTTTYRTKGAWAAVGPVLFVSVVLLLLAGFWPSSLRLRIVGDEVQVIYPFLRGWGNRAFRFGEIASVEVRDAGKGGKKVRIGLHDGSSVRYGTWDQTVIDELVRALKRGVAEAKPAKVDWSELA